MIERAQQKSPALVSYVTRNANAVAYVEFVETPDGKFVIGAEFFPSSKEVSTQTLVNRAIELVKQPDVDEAFGRLSEARSDFVRGDLSIFVYDAEGTRLVNGTNKSQVWKNLLNATDQQGKMIINDLVTIAINGGGWTTYRTRNAQRKVYVKSVPRKLESGKYKNYIVGSGYFL
jgi:signal transduction histidine kinase